MASNSVADLLTSLAPSYAVPPELALAVAQKESALNPKAVSSAGAMGVMQLMPATAASLGVSNPFDPQQNIQGGLQYLSSLYQQYGNWGTALIAYNEGPGNLANKGVFPSSQQYSDSILAAAGLNQGTPTVSDIGAPADTSSSSLSSDISSWTGNLSSDVFSSLDQFSVAGLSGTAIAAIALVIGAVVLLVARR